MEQISPLSRPSTKRSSESNCKSLHKIRILKNKGAIVVLVWNFFIASVFNYLIVSLVPHTWEVSTLAWGLTLPFAGWLADICFGRYKVIRWSMWIMWIVSMLATLISVVEQFVPGHQNTFKRVSQILAFILAIGFGGYQANSVQFGLDQLQDASTTEITAFIIWYVWTYFSNHLIIQFSYNCTKPEYYMFVQLIVCTSITVVISSSHFLDSILVKEPVTQNPFILIYKVIKYAIKNKYPKCRSAFTYCEDELPSRIDFGKSKYGGPFTTEQVEDVKTFLRMIIIIAIASVFTGEAQVSYYESNISQLKYYTKSIISPLKKCYTEKLPLIIFSYTPIVLFIPLHEFVFYPFLQKHLPSLKIYQRFLIGMILHIVRNIILMAYDLTARKKYSELYGPNVPTNCHHPGLLDVKSYRNWMAIPNLIQNVSTLMLSISAGEFLASQTPYSMRGLMVGVGYACVFIFTIIGYGIYWPLTRLSSTWGTGIISCEFWYLFSVLLVSIIVSGLLLVAGRWYKNRKREDVLPNEHIFAERYYA